MPEQLNTLVSVETIDQLKAITPSEKLVAFVCGKSAVNDNLGGTYRWDSSASMADDPQFVRSFAANGVTNGRWVRVFQNTTTLPHGILVNSGGIKTFYGRGTIGAGGIGTLNLTRENTADGTPIFSEVWMNRGEASVNAAGIADVVNGGRRLLTADLRQTSHFFYKANALTITLGLVYSPFAAAPTGTVVQYCVEGI